VLDEILARRNGPRRHRGYPRVIKRPRVGRTPKKRAHHRQLRYDGPPTIQIRPLPATRPAHDGVVRDAPAAAARIATATA
jgi:hypothetical protein